MVGGRFGGAAGGRLLSNCFWPLFTHADSGAANGFLGKMDGGWMGWQVTIFFCFGVGLAR